MNTDALGWVGFGGSWEACAVTGFSCGERRIKAKTDSRGLGMGRVRRGPARLSRNSARPNRGEATGRCCRKLESAGPARHDSRPIVESPPSADRKQRPHFVLPILFAGSA